MNGIQSTGSMQHVARMLMQGGPPASGRPPEIGGVGGMPLPTASAQITNDQGQTLFDIRDDVEKAVSEALENYDGSGDVRSVVEGAIDATLEEHGFDPSAVKEAMEADARNMPRPGGAGAAEGDRFAERFGQSTKFDPASLVNRGSSTDDIVQSFLQQLRSGANLDRVA